MKPVKLLRNTTFQIALTYMAVFAVSVFFLFGFVYWATAGYMTNQIDETIEAEITGLAEQYRQRGVPGLASVIQQRVIRNNDGKSVYLFTTSDFRILAGNLTGWPESYPTEDGWITFQLNSDMGWQGPPEIARARVFVITGGLRLLVGRNIEDLILLRTLIERAVTYGLAMTIALALVVGLMMSRATSRKIESINQTCRRIINGELSTRVPSRGTRDDFDQLADNLNLMLDRIEGLMEGIKHVSDNIAHDLRTPLTRLRNHLEMFAVSLEDEDAKEGMAQVLSEADQLLNTFNALLRIARLESGQQLSQSTAVDMVAVAEDAIELYEALAEDKQLSLHSDLPQAPLRVQGDRDLLFQTLANLLDNAIKYTPESGSISLSLSQRNSSVVLEVADSGIGIAEAEKGKVFQRFYRVAKSRSLPGNGLGLSLVTTVVDLHRGEIRLLDNEPGLKVKITLPVKSEKR